MSAVASTTTALAAAAFVAAALAVTSTTTTRSGRMGGGGRVRRGGFEDSKSDKSVPLGGKPLKVTFLGERVPKQRFPKWFFKMCALIPSLSPLISLFFHRVAKGGTRRDPIVLQARKPIGILDT